MSITVEGFKTISRQKAFKDIACGTSFVGSFKGRFGIWYKVEDLQLIHMSEQGWMEVVPLKVRNNDQYHSVGHYTKVNLAVRIESVDEHPGSR